MTCASCVPRFMSGQWFHRGQESRGLYPRNRYNPGQSSAVYMMRFLLGSFVLAAVVGLSAQATRVPSDPVRAIVERLELERYKAHIKGLSQFGDRMQGTPRNRVAINWLEKELGSFGYTNVQRQRFMSGGGTLENIYATKIGTAVP